jgi:hypothetical protein
MIMKDVKFINKIVPGRKGDEDIEIPTNYIAPDGKVYPEGTEAKVTDKAAIWLEANGYIEPQKKENKKAAKRETK